MIRMGPLAQWLDQSRMALCPGLGANLEPWTLNHVRGCYGYKSCPMFCACAWVCVCAHDYPVEVGITSWELCFTGAKKRNMDLRSSIPAHPGTRTEMVPASRRQKTDLLQSLELCPCQLAVIDVPHDGPLVQMLRLGSCKVLRIRAGQLGARISAPRLLSRGLSKFALHLS